MKLGSPNFIVGKASAIFSMYCQPCKMEVVEKGDKGTTVRISKIEKPSIVVEYRVKGWMEKALEISGAAAPRSV